jgi:two-component system LytT family response regulator
MSEALRVAVADDERPARAFLAEMLAGIPDVALVGEAGDGREALRLVETAHPDLLLLDLQMPELDGLEVVRLLPADEMPLVAFVTAYDEHAVRAFEMNAVDYLLKPVSPARLRETVERARARLARPHWRHDEVRRVEAASHRYEEGAHRPPLERIPVRRREDILLLPVEQLACIEADGEMLHLTTVRNERYTVSYRLKDLEARLDPRRFVRLSRGTLAAVRLISRFSPMPGGTYVAVLATGKELSVSRSQSRVLREQLMKL